MTSVLFISDLQGLQCGPRPRIDHSDHQQSSIFDPVPEMPRPKLNDVALHQNSDMSRLKLGLQELEPPTKTWVVQVFQVSEDVDKVPKIPRNVPYHANPDLRILGLRAQDLEPPPKQWFDQVFQISRNADGGSKMQAGSQKIKRLGC